jgi:hypothetical protein
VFDLLKLIECSFIVCLYLPSEHRDGSVKFAIGAYVAFLVISVIPVFADAISPGAEQDRRWTMSIYFGIHSIFLSWIITALNVAAIYYQVQELRSQAHRQALSHLGLVMQAVVFMLLAGSWIGRVEFPYSKFGGFPWQSLSTWYQLVGWAAVDTAIFAIGQATLLWILSHHTGSDSVAFNSETEPLLRA